MSRSAPSDRAAKDLDDRLGALYRAVLREPVPAWLLATVDQLESNREAPRDRAA
jgi:hypothetical protein